MSHWLVPHFSFARAQLFSRVAVYTASKVMSPYERKTMKIALVVQLFAASALAQSPSDSLPAACGEGNVSFKVKLGDKGSLSAQPEPGKALVYFIHDAGASKFVPYPTTKFGVDGAWVGADHGNSYFAVSVAPGEHHLCATLQSSFVNYSEEFALLTAEPGKVYYYRTRLFLSERVTYLELNSVDSDQGRNLIASYPLSVSTPKGKR
jgi:hypothetical protein